MIAGCYKKHLFFFIIGIIIFGAFLVFSNNVFAQEIDEPHDIYDRDKAIQIASEKGGPGGCNSVEACDAFCGNPSNQGTCMDWALANGVISQENHNKYSGFAKEGGPGGCTTSDECRSYCDNQSHFDECLNHGEKQGLISKEHADQARKTGPGGCRTQKDCQAFCENPQNHDVCIEHAVQEGFMSKAEADRIKEFQARADEFRKKADEFRKQAEEFEPPETEEIDPGFDEDKARQILATQGGPGGCKTFDECEDFCENPNNQETCFAFAEQHDLFEHKEKAEKIKHLIREGGPGGCRGEKECHRFCESEANFETCISFAEKSGLMPPEEIERAKKGIQALREGGPAGCKGKDECEKVCQDPTNQEVCFEWAKKHGLISEEELRFMEEANELRKEFENKRHEFESRPPEGFKPPEGFHPPGEFLGPGGCTGAEECRKYCEDPSHKEECGGFRTPSGQQPPGFEGTLPKHICPLMPEFECKEGQYRKEHITSDGCRVSECVSSTNPVPTYSSEPKLYGDPTRDCAQKSGIWTDNYCKLPEPTHSPAPYPDHSPSPYPQTYPSPSPYQSPYPNEGSTSTDPATECAKRGGTWTGTECKLSSTAPTSFIDHPFLGAISRYLLR